MNKLKERLLSSIELHGKTDIHGLMLMYPDFTWRQVYRQLFVLRNEGWIFISKNRTIDGIKTNNPNVRRTNKAMYTQLSLL